MRAHTHTHKNTHTHTHTHKHQDREREAPRQSQALPASARHWRLSPSFPPSLPPSIHPSPFISLFLSHPLSPPGTRAPSRTLALSSSLSPPFVPSLSLSPPLWHRAPRRANHEPGPSSDSSGGCVRVSLVRRSAALGADYVRRHDLARSAMGMATSSSRIIWKGSLFLVYRAPARVHGFRV